MPSSPHLAAPKPKSPPPPPLLASSSPDQETSSSPCIKKENRRTLTLCEMALAVETEEEEGLTWKRRKKRRLLLMAFSFGSAENESRVFLAYRPSSSPSLPLFLRFLSLLATILSPLLPSPSPPTYNPPLPLSLFPVSPFSHRGNRCQKCALLGKCLRVSSRVLLKGHKEIVSATFRYIRMHLKRVPRGMTSLRCPTRSFAGSRNWLSPPSIPRQGPSLNILAAIVFANCPPIHRSERSPPTPPFSLSFPKKNLLFSATWMARFFFLSFSNPPLPSSTHGAELPFPPGKLPNEGADGL